MDIEDKLLDVIDNLLERIRWHEKQADEQEGYPGIACDFEQAKAERDELRECCREMLDMIERMPEMGKLSPCDGRVRWRQALGRDAKTGMPNAEAHASATEGSR